MDLSLFLLNVVCMYAAGQIALRKRRSLKGWLWCGAIFGPLALLAVAMLPSHPETLAA